MKGLRRGKATDADVKQALSIAVKKFAETKQSFFIDTTGMRKAINALDYISDVVSSYGGDGALIKKAKEEAERIEPVASLAADISTYIGLFAQGRTNKSWTKEHQAIAVDICKKLGVK